MMRFLLKRILLSFYFLLQIFAVSIGLLCGFDSYARIDIVQENIPSGVEEVKNSVVNLFLMTDKETVSGTGFILEDGILVTNVHFLQDVIPEINKDLSQIKIFQENRLLDVQVRSIQALDPVHDLALLNIKGSEISPAIKKPRKKLDLKKQQLFFVGYPKGKLKVMGQKGPIEIFESKNHAEIYMPVFTNNVSGASGSPIINQKGEVVGILTSTPPLENKVIFSNSNHLFSLQNAEYGVQCSKSTSIKNCFKQMEDFHLKEAQKGDAYAQYKLGLYFKVFNEYKKAIKYFEMAAQSGKKEAYYSLGVIYHQGEGVPQNYKKAFEYFKLAAQKGHSEADYNLGIMYYQGEGVPQNYKKAMKHFKLAAQAGNKEAQNFLNELEKNNKKCIEVFNKGAHS